MGFQECSEVRKPALLPIIPEVIATDNCGEATLEVSEEIIPGAYPTNYTIIWTWTATDFCGNTPTAEQVVNVGDNEAPFFTYVPEDATQECGQKPGFEWAVAEDDCGIASLE